MNFRKLGLLALTAASLTAGAAFADNATIQIFPSAARPAVTQSPYVSSDYTNYSWKGLRLYLDATAKSSTATLDCKVQGKDEIANKYYDLVGAAFPQVTGTVAPVATPLVIYPGMTAVANKVTNDVLPRKWRVMCTVGPNAGAGTNYTFSLNGSLQQ